MTHCRSWSAAVLVAVSFIAGCDTGVRPIVFREADTVYHNGNVITGVAGMEAARAVAVAQGRIIAVGSDG